MVFFLRHRQSFLAAMVAVCALAGTSANAVTEYHATTARQRDMIAAKTSKIFADCAVQRHGHFFTRPEAGTTDRFYTFRMMGEAVDEDQIRAFKRIDFRTWISGARPASVNITPQHGAAPAEIREHLEQCAAPAEAAARRMQEQYPRRSWYHHLPLVSKFL
ncbi:MAG: hypothetical protein HY053_09595 [Proteobacteria bacterium]|nr:hypothetical protein [Pseudomonadota bacterium]